VAGAVTYIHSQPDQIQNMAEAKIILLIEERMKHARAHTDAAFNSVEIEISDLRLRVDQMVKRISALEGVSDSDVNG
jgi:hypothetical protein